MKCYICEKEDWFSFEKMNPARELLICKECGNMAYKIEDGEDEKIKKYYESKEYRRGPSVTNLITTQHKLNYIRVFLADYLKGRHGATVGDVGAATGYLVRWLRNLGHKATGSEWGLEYRRFSEHYYGAPLTRELSTKPKYDLITMYHTLEHMIKPDDKLKHYVSLLKDDGHMFISCPEWLNHLEEASGTAMKSWDHLFHKDHINVFTEQSLKNLFLICGLEIVKEDHLQYGQTYLLKKIKPKQLPITPEKWEEVRDKVIVQKQAIDLYLHKRHKEAVELWPAFPEAWNMIIFQENQKDPEEQERIFIDGFKIMGGNLRFKQYYATWLYQNQRYEDALKVFTELMEIRPNEDYIMYIGWCYNFLGNKSKAMNCFNKSLELNPLKWNEANIHACAIANSMPTWEERAIEEFKKAAVKKAGIPEVDLKEDALLEDKQ